MRPRVLLPSIALMLFALWISAGAQNPPPPALQTRNPHGPIAIPCENCHTLTSWKPVRAVPEFDHNKTSYPLQGMHAKVGCADCHTKPVFSNVAAQCSDCHADLHRGQFGANCEQCHTVLGWNVQVQAIRAHQNRFPLLGAHAAVECAACHTGGATGQFQGLSTQCYSCHAQEYRSATEPNHITAKFPMNCETCHRVNTWLDARFDHSATGFSLNGAHAGASCASCHVNNNYNLTAANAQCSACHMPDFQSALSPNHVQANFPTACESCHSSAATWSGATFNHASTGFALTGAHVSTPCASCHLNNNYNLTAANAQCSACHLPDFQSAVSPNHTQAAFPTTCQTCHATTTWTGATFNHAATGFALTGAHVSASCSSCHVNNNYNLTAANAQCSACHMPDFQSAVAPNHVQSGFATTCQTCHSTTSWSGATFNHASTGFALTGAHVSTPCASCHVNNNYNLTAANAACSACHMPDFQGTTNPSHQAAGFPTDCTVCHSTTTWTTGAFNHATTGWALTGSHASVSCGSCHINNNYNLTSTACATCHLADYNATTTPVNHVQLGYPTTCELCHGTVAWNGATFDHNTTGFALTGRHASVACASCHVNNNYTSVPADCYSCHRTVYQTTTDPNHVAAGFPTTCQTCHTTTQWSGATFDHTWFPMTHGNARSVCATCHTNSSDYSVFQCTVCHAASQTNNRHNGVRNYVFNSVNCYQCHPRGRH